MTFTFLVSVARALYLQHQLTERVAIVGDICGFAVVKQETTVLTSRNHKTA